MKRVAAITGVNGGIGRATAKVFHEAGWCVVGVDRRAADVPDCVDHFINADVSHVDAPHQFFETIAARYDRLDALVNNAACQVCKSIAETSVEEFDQIMACNVRSIFLSVQKALPLLTRSGGAIVNVSSVHAVATSVGIAAYAASKGALLALTRAMAWEFGESGIRANAVCPGWIDTPMNTPFIDALGGRQRMDALLDAVQPLGMGTPEQVADVALFLASDESSFVTGTSVLVDGGLTAQ